MIDNKQKHDHTFLKTSVIGSEANHSLITVLITVFKKCDLVQVFENKGFSGVAVC